MKPRGRLQVGTLVSIAVYQSENKHYADAKERERARRQRKNGHAVSYPLIDYSSLDYYATIGEWSPEDELPDPDEPSN